MPEKEELYRRIKIAGIISYIPIILAAGPVAGFFLGDYLQGKFKLPGYVLFISIGAGFIVSLREAVRTIRLVIDIEKKAKNG